MHYWLWQTGSQLHRSLALWLDGQRRKCVVGGDIAPARELYILPRDFLVVDLLSQRIRDSWNLHTIVACSSVDFVLVASVDLEPTAA